MSLEYNIKFLQQHQEDTERKIEDAFDLHVRQFEIRVLQPFCDQHNLRFASAMGQWGFVCPGVKIVESCNGRSWNPIVLDTPKEMQERWEYMTGQVKFVNDTYKGPQRFRSDEWRNWEPSFFGTYRKVYDMLAHDIGRFTLGFSCDDYNSPGYTEKHLKVQARFAEE